MTALTTDYGRVTLRFLPLGASCRVRSVTVLRLAEDVPTERKKGQGEKDVADVTWKGISQPSFLTSQPDSQIPNPLNHGKKK